MTFSMRTRGWKNKLYLQTEEQLKATCTIAEAQELEGRATVTMVKKKNGRFPGTCPTSAWNLLCEYLKDRSKALSLLPDYLSDNKHKSSIMEQWAPTDSWNAAWPHRDTGRLTSFLLVHGGHTLQLAMATVGLVFSPWQDGGVVEPSAVRRPVFLLYLQSLRLCGVPRYEGETICKHEVYWLKRIHSNHFVVPTICLKKLAKCPGERGANKTGKYFWSSLCTGMSRVKQLQLGPEPLLVALHPHPSQLLSEKAPNPYQAILAL